MDPIEVIKRFKRGLDGYLSYRKAFLLIVIVFGFLLYLGPSFLRWVLPQKLPYILDTNSRCLRDRLDTFLLEAEHFDANIRHEPLYSNEQDFLEFVGNGKVGVVLNPESALYIKSKRTLSVPVPFYPIVSASFEGIEPKEATVVHYTSGLAHRFQCYGKSQTSVDIHYMYYAHRTVPSLFVQDIKITNPTDEHIVVKLQQSGAFHWSGSIQTDESLEHSEGITLITGQVEDPDDPDQVYIVAIASTKVPGRVEVEGKNSNLLHFVTSVNYEGPVHPRHYEVVVTHVANKAKNDLQKGLGLNARKLRGDHILVWQQFWTSGFSISYSRAQDAVNGDKINATMYYVLSHAPSPLHEIDTAPARKQELLSLLADPDRCYQGHHTLQASNLWSNLKDKDEVNRVISLWLLTLSKQGCQPLLNGGADGVLQAMILSFGAFKFANHHLEFGTHPSELHRDYFFRRISYGNATHLNVSVQVGDDNKALLYVALDRSDKDYYACDGGCLDPPVLLGPEKKQFPVKLTTPVTATLYITADKQHMEELKHTIHVKEVAEAPAHEHHVLALHRHGHHLGGLPTMFWISIAFLVVIFHLFLFKLIYNEYCGNHTDKFRARYSL